MATPAHASPRFIAPIPILAALALGFGTVAALRLDASARWNLLLIGAAFLATGVALFTGSSHTKKQIGAGALAISAGTLLLLRLLGPSRPELDASVWILIVVAIAFWVDHPAALSRAVLLTTAAMACALPPLVNVANPTLPDAAVQFCAVLAACLSLGAATALDRPSGSSSTPVILDNATKPWWGRANQSTSTRIPTQRFSTVPDRSPSVVLWIATGMAAALSAISAHQAWAPMTVFLLAGALLVDTIMAPHIETNTSFPAPGLSVHASALAVIVIAAALAVTSVAAGTPFGWPVAGAAVAALGSLVVLGRHAILGYATEMSQLRNAARESHIDQLTGLANRRALDGRLGEEIARATRYGHSLAVLMIDVDDFKQHNDRFGHAAGDDLLKAIAGIVSNSIRGIDIAARFGGEEFVVILPETAEGGAEIVAERIRTGVSENLPATVSIGLAELNPPDTSNRDLLERADAAMYRAKRAGKNRVELAR